MKNYLFIAALLGLIAVGSVSFLAQADMPAPKAKEVSKTIAAADAADPSDGEADADNADAADAAAHSPAPPVDKFSEDRTNCKDNAAETKAVSGAPASADKIAEAYIACMHARGYSDATLKSHAADDAKEDDNASSDMMGE